MPLKKIVVPELVSVYVFGYSLLGLLPASLCVGTQPFSVSSLIEVAGGKRENGFYDFFLPAKEIKAV
jgi:hypothetical protein